MTARDEAIQALMACDVDSPLDELVDAIPADVLVRLAIEEGALEAVEFIDRRFWTYHLYDADIPLYRVVEP